MTHPSHLQPITPATALLATTCAVLWGGLAVAIRFTQDDLPPIATAGFRFGLASAILLAWLRLRGEAIRVQRSQWKPILIVALMLFFQIALFHWGLTKTNSAHGSVLIGFNPVFVAVVAHYSLTGDRLTAAKLLGLGLAMGGLLAVVGGDQFFQQGLVGLRSGDAATLGGDANVLTSSFLLGSKTVYTKHVLPHIEAVKLLFWSNLLATAGFFAYSLVFEGASNYQFSAGAVGGLLYQGLVVAGFCFGAWTLLLRHHRASQLAVFSFAQPLCGIFFGAWFRGDPLTMWLLIGGLAVAAGIFIVTTADDDAPEEVAA